MNLPAVSAFNYGWDILAWRVKLTGASDNPALGATLDVRYRLRPGQLLFAAISGF